MDYVLVAYLAADRTALSYAVGEWARIWPLQTLIRSTGAYFVRRSSGDPLYRRVLERYIHMATSAGVTQAVYPEGGLSRDGRLRQPQARRPRLHAPLLRPPGRARPRLHPGGDQLRPGPGGPHPAARRPAPQTPAARQGRLGTTLRFVGRNLALMLRSRWHRFGYACVNFGTPVSMRRWLAEQGLDLRALNKEERSAHLERLGAELMADDRRGHPRPARAAGRDRRPRRAGEPLSELELKARAHRLMQELQAAGAHVYIPRRDQDYAIVAGLRMLTQRHLVEEKDGLYAPGRRRCRRSRYYAQLDRAPAGAAVPARAAAG